MAKNILLAIYFCFLALLSCQIEHVESTEINNCQTNCSKSPQVGPCNAAIPIYYFNREKLRCDTFIWGGCDGVVPFKSYEDCISCNCK